MGAVFFVLSALIVSIVNVSGQNCVPTFQNNQAEMVSRGRKVTRTISGCLIGTQLPTVYGNELTINIKDQVIPSLNIGAISHIQHHLILNITHNQIEIIRKAAFQNLPKLRIVYLNYNHLTTVEPHAFEHLQTIQGIFLQNNNIEVLGKDTFVNLPKLTLIDLGNNKINYIHPDAFYGLNLFEVKLGRNQLTSFDINPSHLSKLRQLDLAHNKITYISTDVLNPIRYSLKKLFVHSNPMQCSCADELISWANKNNITLFWKCNNKEVYCIIPLSDENMCVKRSENEFNVATFQVFESECVFQ